MSLYQGLLIAALIAFLPVGLCAQSQTATPAVLAQYDVKQGDLQDLVLEVKRRGSYELSVVLAGQVRRVRLWPHDVRSPQFALYRDDGLRLTRLPTPQSVTYRGTVLGVPESVVAATVIAGDLEALIRLDAKSTTWGVQALRANDPLAKPGRCLIYKATDVLVGAERCGVVATHSAGAGVDNPANVIAELACDADFGFYQKNGSSVSATQNDVTRVVNAVDLIYQRDVQIQYLVTTIIVRTKRTYTTSASSALLSQFGARWRAQHSQIKRDVAHLFTGRNLDGSTIGVAYLGVICGGAYGLSQSRFSTNLVRRTGLTAHELGHNWSSNHCGGGGCYIMCPSLGGCGRDLTRFNSGSIQSILAHRNSVACLATPGKSVLSGLAPASVLAFGGQTLLVKGQFLSDVIEIDIGGQSFFKPDFEVIDDQTLELMLPQAASLGMVSVGVKTLNQTSNLLPLAYAAASPPVITAPLLGGGGVPVRFEFAGQPAGDWFLLIAFGNQQAFPFFGSQILSQGFVLGKGALDSRGFGAIQVVPPVGSLIGVTLYSQIVELGSAGTVFAGGSSVVPTYIFY